MKKTGKPRNRGAVYPVEIVARLTEEMAARMDQMIESDPTQTKVGIIRKALDKYLPKYKKPAPSEDE
jgi:metal-responsive CopG/Arc/MetJ family transcriptional regulator